jgi:hypothetical protein
MAALLLPVGLFSIEAAAVLGLLVAFPADLLQPVADRMRAIVRSRPQGHDPV